MVLEQMPLQIPQTVLVLLADDDFDAWDVFELVDRAFGCLVGHFERYRALFATLGCGLSIGFENSSLYFAMRVYTRSIPGRGRVVFVTTRRAVCVSCCNAATSHC
jgi:hypothetical protein